MMKKLLFSLLLFISLPLYAQECNECSQDLLAMSPAFIGGGSTAAAAGAIERTGTHSQWCDTSLASHTEAVTVPADTELIVLGCGAYDTANMFDAPDQIPRLCDASDCSGSNYNFTLEIAYDAGTSEQVAIWFLASPAVTGSRWINYDFAGSDPSAEGVQCYAVYYDGVNTAAPDRESCGEEAGGVSASCTTTAAVSGDALIAFSFHNGGTSAVGFTNASDLDSDSCPANSMGAVGYDDDYGTDATITSTGTGATYSTMCAMVIDGD